MDQKLQKVIKYVLYCEGAGETFDVKTDWLDEKLTVSGQLHGELPHHILY